MTGMRLCSVPGCGRPQVARGWCDPHRSRVRSGAGLQPHIPIGALSRRSPNLVADLTDLLAHGVPLDAAVQRLRVSVRTIQRAFVAAGVPAPPGLAALGVRQNPTTERPPQMGTPLASSYVSSEPALLAHTSTTPCAGPLGWRWEEQRPGESLGAAKIRWAGAVTGCRSCPILDACRARAERGSPLDRSMVVGGLLPLMPERQKAAERSAAVRPECVVGGCDRVSVRGSGMCGAHRSRFRRHGDVLAHIPIGSTAKL